MPTEACRTGQREVHLVLARAADGEGAAVEVDLAADRGVTVGIEVAVGDGQGSVQLDRVEVRGVVGPGIHGCARTIDGHRAVEAEAALGGDRAAGDRGVAAEGRVFGDGHAAAGHLEGAGIREAAGDRDVATVDHGAGVGHALLGVGDVDRAVVDQATAVRGGELLELDVAAALDHEGGRAVHREVLAVDLTVPADHDHGVAVEGHVVGDDLAGAGGLADRADVTLRGVGVDVEAEFLELLHRVAVREVDRADQQCTPPVEIDVAVGAAARAVVGGVEGRTIGDLEDASPCATVRGAAAGIVQVDAVPEVVPGATREHQARGAAHAELPFGGGLVIILAFTTADDAAGQEGEAITGEGEGPVAVPVATVVDLAVDDQVEGVVVVLSADHDVDPGCAVPQLADRRARFILVAASVVEGEVAGELDVDVLDRQGTLSRTDLVVGSELEVGGVGGVAVEEDRRLTQYVHVAHVLVADHVVHVDQVWIGTDLLDVEGDPALVEVLRT